VEVLALLDDLLGTPTERWSRARCLGNRCGLRLCPLIAALDHGMGTTATDVDAKFLGPFARLLQADLAGRTETVPEGLAALAVAQQPRPRAVRFDLEIEPRRDPVRALSIEGSDLSSREGSLRHSRSLAWLSGVCPARRRTYDRTYASAQMDKVVLSGG